MKTIKELKETLEKIENLGYGDLVIDQEITFKLLSDNSKNHPNYEDDLKKIMAIMGPNATESHLTELVLNK